MLPIDDHKTEQYIKMLEGDANAPQAVSDEEVHHFYPGTGE